MMKILQLGVHIVLKSCRVIFTRFRDLHIRLRSLEG